MKVHSPRALASAATGWHVSSQQHSRRNALVASTTMAQQRLERLEVEEFLAGLEAPTALPASRPAREDRRTRSA